MRSTNLANTGKRAEKEKQSSNLDGGKPLPGQAIDLVGSTVKLRNHQTRHRCNRCAEFHVYGGQSFAVTTPRSVNFQKHVLESNSTRLGRS